MSKEVLSKANLLVFYEQIPRKKISRNLSNFKTRLLARGYPKNLVEILSEVCFTGRQSALKRKKKTAEQILRFVTAYHPGVKTRPKKYIDIQMLFNSKSAIAEDHFQKASYYIIEERQITN